MKVTVDLNKCTGQGRCYNIATDIFEAGPDKKSVITVALIDDEDTALQLQAQSAEMMCPEAAISIED
ncbi:MAG: ferredoxin [Gammaproteobacteria bacterium]|nr:ferredoxin [Gammaproteobacteria bacterium]